MKACIKSIKCTIIKCIDTKSDIHISLLQIRSTVIGLELPNSAMLLFNHPIRGIMPIISRLLVNSNNDEEHYETLVKIQRMIKTIILQENYFCFPLGSSVIIQ